LTEQQREEFRRDGYTVVRGLITPAEVGELLRDYDRAVRGEFPLPRFEGVKPGTGVVQLAHPSQHLPGWRGHAYFRNALAAARELLGEDQGYFYDQIIFKPPHTPGETHWHQDAGYWSDGPANVRALTCWLSLGRAFPENGGMQFIPGSHLGPVLEHHALAGDATLANELATSPTGGEPVACRLKPGDATFHHCRTLHYTGSNRSDVPRHGLVTHFKPLNG
jgi:ectoine hydroxylase-related dioxygenase (phytanoyl-CoA dioxygenase family)